MPTTCDTLLSASFIVTQNPQREILTEGAVAVKDGVVVAVGSKKELAGYSAANYLDLGQAILMPGLCNAHGHVAMTYLRGLADDLPLMEWLTRFIFPVEKHLTTEIVEITTLLGCAEMIRTGTTAFTDMYLLEEAGCKAVDASGLKALVGEGLFAFPSPAYANSEAGFSLVRRLAAKWKQHPRIRMAVMPHTVYTTNRDILTQSAQLAKELAMPVHIHVAETLVETQASLKQYGKRPLAVCQEAGLLGETTCIAHAVDLTPEEIDLLVATGTKVAHNPKSNLKLASGVAPIPLMLRKGMLPGLGTDGAASNNSLNMFSEMNVCALLHKGVHTDPTMLSAQTTLDMATLGSAAAMMTDSFGSIEKGKAADFTALDLSAPNMQPMYQPVSHLVYAASGHEVCFTMVDGRVLYDKGNFATIDYPALLKEISKIIEWVKNKVA